MKQTIYILIALVITSCSEKKLVGIGNAKLGMTIGEFNHQFDTNYPEKNESFTDTNYHDLVVDKYIILKDVSVHFTNFKLTRIATDYDIKLLGYLKRYGIKENNDSGVIFNTDDSIFCTAGKKHGKFVVIGIIDQKNNRN